MTAPFTAITTPGLHPWHHTIFEEIQLAYSERRQSIGQSALDPLPATHNPLDLTWYRNIQSWCQSNADEWHNHTLTIPATIPFESQYTLETFQDVAGLVWGSNRGFRRVTDLNWDGISPPTFEYGLAQDDDLFGYWLIEDLQSALSAFNTIRLQAGRSYLSHVDYFAEYSSRGVLGHDAGSPTDGRCQRAYAENEQLWPSSSWSNYTSSIEWIYRAMAFIDDRGFVGYDVASERHRGRVRHTNIPDHVPHALDSYAVAGRSLTKDEFRDIDGLGITGYDAIYQFASLPSAKLSSRDTPVIGDSDENPLTNSGLSCPLASLDEQHRGVILSFYFTLLKWEFTNANP